MKVIKIGGGCLKDGPTAKIILTLAAAMYFLVHEDSLDTTIQALHDTFFNSSPPLH